MNSPLKDENINSCLNLLMKMNRIKKTFSDFKKEFDFKDIDKQLLEGFECSQFNNHNKKFLSMIREQTNSALNNEKYWST